MSSFAVTITVRGVMISFTATSSKRKRFLIILDSESAKAPDSSATFVIAEKSARLYTLLLLSVFNRFVMPWLSHTKGPSAVTRISILRTANGASRRQLFAPIVFGMISEKTKIARVISAAMTDSHPTDKPRKSNPL